MIGMRCAKCLSKRIVGPWYARDWYGREQLHYQCVTCGYRWQTATADAQAQRRGPGVG